MFYLKCELPSASSRIIMSVTKYLFARDWLPITRPDKSGPTTLSFFAEKNNVTRLKRLPVAILGVIWTRKRIGHCAGCLRRFPNCVGRNFFDVLLLPMLISKSELIQFLAGIGHASTRIVKPNYICTGQIVRSVKF